MTKAPTSMRTPLSRVRGLGSARAGTENFWRERITSLALIPLAIAFVIVVIGLTAAPYEFVRAELARPFTALLMALFVLTGIVHMRAGMQVIIEDYVHTEGRKMALLVANTFFCAVLAAACLWALARIGFGG